MVPLSSRLRFFISLLPDRFHIAANISFACTRTFGKAVVQG